ncbi:MAG: MFS transporter [Arachnia propionica]|jgi:MFS transporter|nr:MFS transporter [Arachnia propionica]
MGPDEYDLLAAADIWCMPLFDRWASDIGIGSGFTWGCAILQYAEKEIKMSSEVTARTPSEDPVNINLAIMWMLLGVFAVGTVEYLVAGVLPQISHDMTVTEATAGLLVTVYALTVVIGGPLLTIATSRVKRIPLVLALMTLFIAGNLLTALAPSFPLLVIARTMTALPHATFFALCLVLATTLVGPSHQSRVIARIALGLNLATVLGVPLGTLIGNQYGWRSSFLVVAIFQTIVTVALVLTIRYAPEHTGGGITAEVKVFGRGEVLKALGLTMLSQSGLFVLFTFITPYLGQHAGLGPNAITLILFVFGVGSIVGNMLGGHFADRNMNATLYIALGTLAASLFILFLFGNHAWFTAVWMFIVGAAGFSIIPPLTSKLIGAASNAPNLATTVNIAGFQLANAAGAWIGSTTLSMRLGVGSLPLIGAALALVAVCLLWLTNVIAFRGQTSGGQS